MEDILKLERYDRDDMMLSDYIKEEKQKKLQEDLRQKEEEEKFILQNIELRDYKNWKLLRGPEYNIEAETVENKIIKIDDNLKALTNGTGNDYSRRVCYVIKTGNSHYKQNKHLHPLAINCNKKRMIKIAQISGS